jgi:hypothetical protein
MATEIFVVCKYAGERGYVELIAFNTLEEAEEFNKIVVDWFEIKPRYDEWSYFEYKEIEKEWEKTCPFPGLIENSFSYQIKFVIRKVKLVSNLKELK